MKNKYNDRPENKTPDAPSDNHTKHSWLAGLGVLVLTLAFSLMGCGTPTTQTKDDPFADCSDTQTQPSPFLGSLASKTGTLEGTPPKGYAVVATQMKVRLDSKTALASFQAVMGPIQQALGTQEGLLGASLYFSQKCGNAKTITVWKDADSMMKFVASDAHSNAMAKTKEIASHFRTTQWKGETTAWPVTWEISDAKLLPLPLRSY